MKRLSLVCVVSLLAVFGNIIASAADLNILIVGSSKSFSDGNESGVVKEKAFSPNQIATELENIIADDSAISGTVNVSPEDIFKTKFLTVNYSGSSIYDFTSHCYSLAQHYLWPEGKDARLANLRGEGGVAWDYVILLSDPYVMANFPGMYAEGVKLMVDEIKKGSAEPILLAQWPENSSTFTAAKFNEIVYRVGSSAEVRVVPAGKAWSTLSNQDSSSSHPTPRGAYLAAASIYSELYNRSAKTSSYVFGNSSTTTTIADHALSVVQANQGVAQYTGDFTDITVYTMKYVNKRTVTFRETGTSTEDRLRSALMLVDDRCRVTFVANSGTFWDFNYGRGNDWWEDAKDYEVNPSLYDRSYGFPMHHYQVASAYLTMPYGIDKHYSALYGYEDGTDLGIAYNMIRPGTRELGLPLDVRSIPIRLLWQKMCEVSPGFNPLGDNTHMHPNLNDASAAFMYTLLSGRCPVVDEPATPGSSEWLRWLGHKTGYETAWQMSHLTTRAPGFKVLPSAATALNINPTSAETMTVQFMMPPKSDVTVTITSSDTSIGVVGPQKLIFTPSNYNTPQPVTVSGVPGSPTSAAVDIQFSTASDDEIYDGLADSWEYINNRTASTITHTDNGTTQYSTPKNFPITINLNASGADAGNTVFCGPNHGSLSWSGADVIYTPDTDYVGPDGFAYWVLVNTTLTTGYIEIDVLDGYPAGSVRAEVADATATEEGPTTGSVTVIREGDTSSDLAVNFSLSGTATDGADYSLSVSNPLTIPAGQSSITIIVTPVDDSVFGEHDETCVLTVASGSGYTPIISPATVTISDNDNNVPVVTIHNADPTVVALVEGAGGGDPVAGSYFEWDAAQDTGGNNAWPSTTANTYTWTFDGGSQSSSSISDVRFDRLTQAYTFPAAKDIGNTSWDGLGSNQSATFEFVLDADADDGLLFESGGTTIGIQFDISGGTLRGYIKNGSTFTVSYPLTATDKSRFIHAVFVVTVNGTFDLYVDGDLKQSVTFNQADWSGSDGAGLGNTSGTAPNGNKVDFAGKLALFRYYRNTAFTANDVTTNFNSLSTGTSVSVNLDATVVDPEDNPTMLWTVESGPASVTIDDSSAEDTVATFTVEGTYRLRLTADDGYGPVFDEFDVIVGPAGSPIADVSLPAGISLYGYTGENTIDAQAGFQTLIDNSQLSLVRWVNPADGQIKELYYTTFPSPVWINEIGDLTLGQGYVVKTNAACTLSITGNKSTADVSHDLPSGYSIIGFNKETPQDAQAAFQPLIDLGKLELIRWVDPANGQIKELYYTTYPSTAWVNEIGDLVEGQGYIIKLNAAHNGFVMP